MKKSSTEATTADLKRAYRRTGLALLGISYAKALQEKAIRISLECVISAARRRDAKRGKKHPEQPALL